ncbi:MFS transporter [Anatilimnocola floriformis]|uniref:MFS transporter n=1 Tax=Anatilimnocola floriformis TaxID=2948575 RepID=UPI0020C3B997|nr:MFS transporter [Anatilimnocola floriformis]
MAKVESRASDMNPAKTQKQAAKSLHEPADNSRGRIMALAAALLGWMFDGAEMGIFSLVGRGAIQDLLKTQDEGLVGLWYTVIVASFLVGAATGGVVFGWLGDRIGRVRAMTLSVLTYALFTGLGGFAAEAWQVGVLRFIAALGMGGEWSLGVALVMEVWPNKSRAFMAGLIGAAANFGYLLVGALGLVMLQTLSTLDNLMHSIGVPNATADWLIAHKGWRLMMISGTLPAVLTFLIRVFVPESEKWEHEQKKGTTNHWASQDLLAVLIGLSGPALIVYLWAADATRWPGAETDLFRHSWPLRVAGTLVGLSIALVGYTYPVIRYFQRQASAGGQVPAWRGTLSRMLLGACLSGVALLGTWGATQSAPSWVDKLNDAEFKQAQNELIAAGQKEAATKLVRPAAREWTLIWLSVGAIVGTLAAAAVGDWIGRRPAYFLLCLLSMVTAWALYLLNDHYGPVLLFWTFIVGAMSASFYGWLPLYLPELFGTSVRATGQGFSFNFGRILAAIGVLQMGSLLKIFHEPVVLGGLTIPAGFPLACSAICLVYLVGMVIIWFAPETKGQPLPD